MHAHSWPGHTRQLPWWPARLAGDLVTHKPDSRPVTFRGKVVVTCRGWQGFVPKSCGLCGDPPGSVMGSEQHPSKLLGTLQQIIRSAGSRPWAKCACRAAWACYRAFLCFEPCSNQQLSVSLSNWLSGTPMREHVPFPNPKKALSSAPLTWHRRRAVNLKSCDSRTAGPWSVSPTSLRLLLLLTTQV